jgi:hypothetical protein
VALRILSPSDLLNMRRFSMRNRLGIYILIRSGNLP